MQYIQSKMNNNYGIQIQIKGYTKEQVQEACLLLRRSAACSGVVFKSSEVSLPTRITKWTVIKSPHIDKKSRDQYEKRLYKRLVLVSPLKMMEASSYILEIQKNLSELNVYYKLKVSSIENVYSFI